jgi:hypothetical protein
MHKGSAARVQPQRLHAPTCTAAANPCAGYLAVPRSWSAAGLGTFMVCIGPTSSIFDITTFVLLWCACGRLLQAYGGG